MCHSPPRHVTPQSAVLLRWLVLHSAPSHSQSLTVSTKWKLPVSSHLDIVGED